MYLKYLYIKGFRNYRQQELQFNPHLNIIKGDNAQGKTNLIEAIYYLSVTRSFRTYRDLDLTGADAEYFVLKGIFSKKDFYDEVQASYRRNGQMRLKINGDQAKRFEHIRRFPTVVFSPDDLLLVKEGPSVRRKFLNLEASRLDSLYLDTLKDYQRVLAQRNHILKEKKSRNKLIESLEPWDISLVKLGSAIIKTRVAILESLEKEARDIFSKITAFQESLSLEYSCTVEADLHQPGLQDLFHEQLINKRDEEFIRGSTALGPHLDDFKILINNTDSRRYASQGQIRTAVLALKMGEVNLFQKINNEAPILLLDDVLSEFDAARRDNLLEFLRTGSGQCFITTAGNIKEMAESLKRDYDFINIKQGNAYFERDRPDS